MEISKANLGKGFIDVYNFRDIKLHCYQTNDLMNDESYILESLLLVEFPALFKYMINDLKEKGYTKAIVGAEPKELINKEIYNHYGFTEYIKTSSELYPDGTKIEVEYYGKVM